MPEFIETDAELMLTLEDQAVGSIANNLTTTVEGYALDARQGYVLDNKKLDKSKVANNLTTIEAGLALDARQGKWLYENTVGYDDIANDLTTDDPKKVLSAAQGKVLAYAARVYRELLWENASPMSEFAEQTVSLNLSTYSRVGIDYGYNTNEDGFEHFEFGVGTNANANAKFLSLAENVAYLACRNAYVRKNGILFYNCYRYSSWAEMGTNEVKNGQMIPWRIYGIKGVPV